MKKQKRKQKQIINTKTKINITKQTKKKTIIRQKTKIKIQDKHNFSIQHQVQIIQYTMQQKILNQTKRQTTKQKQIMKPNKTKKKQKIINKTKIKP